MENAWRKFTDALAVLESSRFTGTAPELRRTVKALADLHDIIGTLRKDHAGPSCMLWGDSLVLGTVRIAGADAPRFAGFYEEMPVRLTLVNMSKEKSQNLRMHLYCPNGRTLSTEITPLEPFERRNVEIQCAAGGSEGLAEFIAGIAVDKPAAIPNASVRLPVYIGFAPDELVGIARKSAGDMSAPEASPVDAE